MDKILFAIQEWHEKKLPNVLPRMIDLEKYLNNDFIIDIIGSRRAGKTYLMYYFINHLKKDRNIIFLNFENRKLWPLSDTILDDLLNHIYEEKLIEKYGKVYLFLDEIQNVPNWERFARNIHDELKGKIKIFVSGSSSKMIEKETSSLLTGRHLSIKLFPLSFKEFLNFKKYSTKGIEYSERRKAVLLKLLKEYLEFGGFPEIVLSDQKTDILSQYYIDIISRDVVERYNLRESNTVENLGKYMITNIGSLFSYGKTAKFFSGSLKIRVSTASIPSYTKHLEEVFLIFLVPIFSYKIREQMQYPRKTYCVDTGLGNAISFKFSEDTGKIMENMVFLELKRRRKSIFYWKGKGEVDFVIKEGLNVAHLMQVCYDVKNEETKKRETAALIEAMNEFGLKEGHVITWDYDNEETVDNKKIVYLPLWKWLLDSKSIKN